MKRLGFLCAVLVGTSSLAAELTRVASSFEEKDPFGMFVDFTFDRTADRGTITREWYLPTGGSYDVTELRYQKYDVRLGIDVNIGIYKDVELHVGVPIIFQQDRNWFYADGSNENVSTIQRNCDADAAGNGCTDPGRGENSLLTIPGNSYRSGLGDFTFGIGWNPFVQAKDPSKPTWTLRFDYTAPTAALLNPSIATTSSNRGGVGEKIHKYTFSTAVSKKVNRYLEPYMSIWYTLPFQAPGFYSNCDGSPSALSYPQNCGKEGWSRSDTGIKPAHTGGATVGFEITAFEREERHQRFAFDFRGFFNYTSEGRYYNELSDLFGKLLYSSDYGTAGGQFGIIGQAAEFIKLKAITSFAYNTERFLTNENVGKDLNGNGQVDVTTAPQEINPNFDYRADRVGRRFRIEQQYVFKIQVTATFNF